MSLTRLVHRSTSTGQAALMFLLPHGGQHLARRNAWASMASDVARARARNEAAAAMALAVTRRQATA
jgi:hypothetical protein